MITLINPPIVDRRYNFTYSVDIPLGLAYMASYLISKKVEVQVIDAVGQGINDRRKYRDGFSIIGLKNKEIVGLIDKKTRLIALSIRYSTQHNVVMDLIKEIKSKVNIPIVIGGNHATYKYKDFLEAGADYVIRGEGEVATRKLYHALINQQEIGNIKGVISNSGPLKEEFSDFIDDLDSLPFPARDMFPLENYFLERSAFGPTNRKYTSITSSRGCPNRCSFCTSAVFWQKWRNRSPKNVVDEIEECVEKHGITEFHFVDDNLTLDKKRMIDICNDIIQRKLNIVWGATNGIRPENIDFKLLKLMKKSGCNQITLAPESGSQRVLKDIYNKTIDLKKILRIITYCNRLKIKTAAYIIIGAIGETDKDRRLTKKYIGQMAKNGLDEIGAFVLIPYPESPITKRYQHIKEINNWEELCTGIIPEWYPNAVRLKKFKRELYLYFLTKQTLHQPLKVFNLVKNLFLGRQEIKSDRVVKNTIRQIHKIILNKVRII